MEQILQYFPKNKTPRHSQEVVIQETISAIKAGYQNILIEAPVGSGKSAIALSLSNYMKEGHILTPRKSLQTQYEEDFIGELVGMRGRKAYTCEVDKRKTTADCVLRRKEGYAECADTICPYVKAIRAAQDNSCVVHNYHSFIYQAALYGRFEVRPIILFDEAHEIPNIVREFSTSDLQIQTSLIPKTFVFPEKWSPEALGDLILSVLQNNTEDNLGESTIKYLDGQLLKLGTNAQFLTEDNYVFGFEQNRYTGITSVSFIPIRVGGACESLLYSFGNTRIFLSGTIYSKNTYCSMVGLDPEKTKFIKVDSTFPAANRPVYLRQNLAVDTSFKEWDNNFSRLVTSIKEVMTKFGDAKGLIHAPSYKAAGELVLALADTNRVVTHTPETTELALAEFYADKGNKVFISPTCQQGVDFKYDRAKFQIILRVPYPNASDLFVKGMLNRKDYFWYKYQALVIFGQQLGRVVRAEDDFGATILLDSRFSKFLKENWSMFPSWLTTSFKLDK